MKYCSLEEAFKTPDNFTDQENEILIDEPVVRQNTCEEYMTHISNCESCRGKYKHPQDNTLIIVLTLLLLWIIFKSK